jgi:hypothetical protein
MMISDAMIEKSQVLQGFSEDARVWLYVADRKLSEHEGGEVLSKSQLFAQSWTAHNHLLSAGAFLLYDQILVLIVDETKTSASGCSIDKSTHFVEGIGKLFDVDFFVRDLVFYQDNEGLVSSVKLNQLSRLLSLASITPETLVLDTQCATIGAFSSCWKPLEGTWMKRWM